MKEISEMPDSSRVWVYQSDRFLTDVEVGVLRDMATSFVGMWESHGQILDASAEVFHNLFVVIAVNESTAAASGCGIDKSVSFIKKCEERLGISLMDRHNVAYQAESELKLSRISDFWALRKAGVVTGDTLLYNNLVKTTGELRTEWLVPFDRSWHREIWGA